MAALISIVITTYNRERYLKAAIESVLLQSRGDFELLIWDDGSRDGSVSIAQEYAKRDNRIRVVAAKHRGRVRSLNAAIAQTTGSYIGWVDSDDLLAPAALKETTAVLDAQPEVGFVYTDYLDIEESGKVRGYGTRCHIPYSKERLLLDFITFHFRLIRRTVFEQVGGLDESVPWAEDYDLCLKLSEVTQVRHIKKPLYYYRCHPQSISVTHSRQQAEDSVCAIAKSLERRGLADCYQVQLEILQNFPFQSRVKLTPKQAIEKDRGTKRVGEWGSGGVGEWGKFATHRAEISSHPSRLLPVPLSPTPLVSSRLRVLASGCLFKPLASTLLPLASCLLPTLAQAQAITPAADGTNTSVTSTGNQFNITGGSLSSDGKNLFHSFNQFGLNQNQVANFFSNSSIDNILGRVTGGNPSIINGLIQVSGGNSNLFLMNPAGIVFGSGASLNVPASFTATTASGIALTDKSGTASWLNAVGSHNYADLRGTPSGFDFSTAQSGAIVNAGQLAVGQGKDLTLLGGTVVNTGGLQAPGGQVTITAVPGSSLVRFSQPGNVLSLEIQPSSTNGTAANSALSVLSLPQLLTGGNAGTATGLMVNGNGQVVLNSSGTEIPTDAGTAIVSGTVNASGQTGGTVQVLGNRVGVVGANIDASGILGGGTVLIGGDYQGIGTLPNASRTYISPDSAIAANSLLNGNGGRVIVWANDISGFYGNISARGGANSGNGGFVEVSGKQDLIFRGNVDVSAPNGSLGSLLLDPANIQIVAGAAGTGANDAELADSTILSTDSPGATFTISQGTLQNQLAAVTLQATNDITIAPGVSLNFAGFFGPPITFTADADNNGVGSFVMGAGDTIRTQGRNLTISGASITAGTINTSTVGNGGNITLTSSAGSVTATDLIGSGYNGGNIAVTASDNITVRTITSTGGGVGAPFLTVNGGNVNLTAGGTITVTDAINTSASLTSDGSPTVIGGSVSLRTDAIAGSTGRTIRFASINTTGTITGLGTGSVATGRGGNVQIVANGLVQGTTAGTTINSQGNATAAQGTAVPQGGAIAITHDGGPDNVPFSVGNASINGTSGAIVAGPGANTILPGQQFPAPNTAIPNNVTSTQGNISITFINQAPTLTANTQLAGTQQNQSVTFRLADLNPTTGDVNADNRTIVIDAITDGGTLTRNNVPLGPGDTVAVTDVLVYTPPPGFTGQLNDALRLRASDRVSVSAPVPIGINVTPTPIPTPTFTPTPIPTPTPTFTPTPTPTPSIAPPEASPITPLGLLSGTQSCINSGASFLDGRFSHKFEEYIGSDVARKTQRDPCEVLADLEQDTGIKPAIIYVSFVPDEIIPGGTPEQTNPNNDQLEVLLITAKGPPLRKRIRGATREQVIKTAQEFRRQVTDVRRSRGYLAPSQQLYQWMIAPIKADLQARGIQNLVFIMDTGLRSIPIAALSDGKEFIIERYSVGLMPSISLTDTRYKDIKSSQVLAMGAEKFTEQNSLPAVPVELSTIAGKLWRGKYFLNDAFTLDNLKLQRQKQPFGIVHLATHGQFQPGTPNNSYIQLADTKLRLDQLRQLGWNKPPVELLVLSACRTALGDEQAELGFAGLSVLAGVKSSLASLWYVSDQGTLGLMTEFYEQLKTAPIKAEALRQAQLAMIKGQVRIENGKLHTPGADVPLPPEMEQLNSQTLEHPYYWAAFTMIGNPW
jgi:filamentous hemagglutinin family protein